MSNGDLYTNGNQEDKNTHVYCNRATSKNQSSLKINAATTQNIPNDSATPVDWDPLTLDQSGNDLAFDPMLPSRVYANLAGDYLVSATLTFTADVTGIRQIFLTNTAGDVLAFNSSNPVLTGTSMNMSTVVNLAVNDYIVVNAYQNSGAPLALIDSSFCERLTVNKLV